MKRIRFFGGLLLAVLIMAAVSTTTFAKVEKKTAVVQQTEKTLTVPEGTVMSSFSSITLIATTVKLPLSIAVTNEDNVVSEALTNTMVSPFAYSVPVVTSVVNFNKMIPSAEVGTKVETMLLSSTIPVNVAIEMNPKTEAMLLSYANAIIGNKTMMIGKSSDKSQKTEKSELMNDIGFTLPPTLDANNTRQISEINAASVSFTQTVPETTTEITSNLMNKGETLICYNMAMVSNNTATMVMAKESKDAGTSNIETGKSLKV